MWWENFRDEEHAHFGLTFPRVEYQGEGEPFRDAFERLEALLFNAKKFPNIDLVRDIEDQRRVIAGTKNTTERAVL